MNTLEQAQETWNKLTPREIEIVRAAADGLSCKLTAVKLGTTEKTIQVHRHNLLRKIGAGNIAGAVAQLIRGGIIS